MLGYPPKIRKSRCFFPKEPEKKVRKFLPGWVAGPCRMLDGKIIGHPTRGTMPFLDAKRSKLE